MENVESKKYSLNKKDGVKIAKGLGYAIGGAVLAFLIDLIPSVDFGAYTPVVAPALSGLLLTSVKWLNGQNNS